MGTTGPDLGSFTRPATDVPIPRPVGPVTKFQKNYAWKSVCNAWDELRRCRQGSRNATLNGLAYSLAGKSRAGGSARTRLSFGCCGRVRKMGWLLTMVSSSASLRSLRD